MSCCIPDGIGFKFNEDGLTVENLFTDNKTAIILLCGVFGESRLEKPLSLKQYTKLVHWLRKAKMCPGDLLHKKNVVEASNGTGIDRQRLEALLGRGVPLAMAVEKWHRNGIWIISRSDHDYPSYYKKHLKNMAPPLLFGTGNRSLLSGGGLGIVGSRNVDQSGEIFSRKIAKLCASNNMRVVSGGARGVDQISMEAVLEAGGQAIGILAESLLKKIVVRKNRQAIADGRLLLLSPYHPNARFNVGNAMSRNKLIYAMADYGMVVSAEDRKGGTWNGAAEELKRENSKPVFVRIGNDVPQGNHELQKLGAIPWTYSVDSFKQQLKNLATRIHESQHEKIYSHSVQTHMNYGSDDQLPSGSEDN